MKNIDSLKDVPSSNEQARQILEPLLRAKYHKKNRINISLIPETKEILSIKIMLFINNVDAEWGLIPRSEDRWVIIGQGNTTWVTKEELASFFKGYIIQYQAYLDELRERVMRYCGF